MCFTRANAIPDLDVALLSAKIWLLALTTRRTAIAAKLRPLFQPPRLTFKWTRISFVALGLRLRDKFETSSEY